MIRALLVAGVLSLAATTASAQIFGGFEPPEPTTNPGSGPDVERKDRVDPDKVVCRNVKPPTGTRIGSARSRQRLCMTQRDWDIQEQDARDALKGIDNNGAFDKPNENFGPQ